MHTTSGQRTTRATRWVAATSLTFALALGATACGSDKDDTSAGASTTTVATATTEATTTTAVSYASFCDTWLEVDATPSPGGPDGPPAAADVKAFAVSIQPQAAALVAEAPPELADTVATLSKAVDTAASTGDSSSLESDEFSAASAKGETWLHEHCGYQNVDVMAMDYAYKGVPSALKAGKTSILLANHSAGHEVHEMIILRRKAGVTDKVADLLALPDEQAFAKVDFVGAAFAPPDQTTGLLTDLTPGGYIGVCFLPVGGADGNPPHFSKGMIVEFTVS